MVYNMTIATKVRIKCAAAQAFEAFVDPALIGNFWFDKSSARWQAGEKITLYYAMYGAEFDIEIIELVQNKQITFYWGDGAQRRTCTLLFEQTEDVTTVCAQESGFDEHADGITALLLNSKEGWTYMLCCLKAYLECGCNSLRHGLINN